LNAGAWIVYTSTYEGGNVHLYYLTDNELDARRWSDANDGHHKITYWQFGTDWYEVLRASESG
jgi:hypothetical protein